MYKKTHALVESAIMIALATVLSYVKVWEMPMGGAITLCSMLPIILVSVKYGTKWGVGAAFVYSLIQTLQAIISGNVFPYCKTLDTIVICEVFDYLIPFTFLGFAGILRNLRKPCRNFGIYLGIGLALLVRFLCHFVSGVVIWSQWAEDMGPYLYSFLYNGTYLLPELIITLAAAIFLLEVPSISKHFRLNA